MVLILCLHWEILITPLLWILQTQQQQLSAIYFENNFIMKFEANKIVSIIFLGKISFQEVYFVFTVFSSKLCQNFLVTNY